MQKTQGRRERPGRKKAKIRAAFCEANFKNQGALLITAKAPISCFLFYLLDMAQTLITAARFERKFLIISLKNRTSKEFLQNYTSANEACVIWLLAGKVKRKADLKRRANEKHDLTCTVR